jgi:hypothetical protein
MKPEDVDRALSTEPDIAPSSGFVDAVMDAVTAEATAPPLPFPWKRAWPLAAGFLVLLVWLPFLPLEPETNASTLNLVMWFEMLVPMATGWVAGGLLMALAATAWSLRLVRFR